MTAAIDEETRVCRECGQPFGPNPGQPPSAHRRRNFCSRTCSSRHNGRGNRPRRAAQPAAPTRVRDPRPMPVRPPVDTSWHADSACRKPGVDRELFFGPDGESGWSAVKRGRGSQAGVRPLPSPGRMPPARADRARGLRHLGWPHRAGTEEPSTPGDEGVVKALPPPVSPSTHRRRYCLALAGEVPGEALHLRDADRLVVALHGQGWTDVQIATHTRWSTYTVARKRERLGLQPNTTKGAAA